MNDVISNDFLGKSNNILSLDEIRDRVEFDFSVTLREKHGNNFLRLYVVRLKAWNLLRMKYHYFHKVLGDDAYAMMSVEDHKTVCSSVLVSLEHCIKEGLRLYRSLSQMGTKSTKDIERFIGDPNLNFQSNDCELTGVCICDMAHAEPYDFSCLGSDLTSLPIPVKRGEQKRMVSSGSMKSLKVIKKII